MTSSGGSEPLLRIDAVTKRFGGFVALDNVSVDIRPGERLGLIGPNGSGKTTLINCICGALRLDAGTVTFRGEDVSRLPPHVRTRRGIARSFQIPRPFKSMTVAENLMVALDFAKVAGGFVALDNVSVDIRPGERLGLIGPNGSGKTTLINCISGAFRTEPSTVIFGGEDITRLAPHVRTRRGIARSFQIPRPFKSMTVIENLMVAADFTSATHLRLSADDHRDSAMAILQQMGLAAKADARVTGLSQVELRKMELARALATRPKLLISDEAMAGLSGSEVDEVLDLLIKLAGESITIIMIEHIMQAVMRFSQRIMCLDAGKIIAIGQPSDVMANARVQEAYLGT